jgi:hypothetical protein
MDRKLAAGRIENRLCDPAGVEGICRDTTYATNL